MDIVCVEECISCQVKNLTVKGNGETNPFYIDVTLYWLFAYILVVYVYVDQPNIAIML